jgi:transcriptional antiterminator RfaH
MVVEMVQAGSDGAWFVAQLKPNSAGVAQTHLARQGFETFNPRRMETLETRSGRLRTQERALFPGYLFIRFDPADRAWRAINSTRGVSRLILSDPTRPQPLPASFVAGLFARCDSSGLLCAPEALAEGDRVRIVSGPFADVVTRIERLKGDARVQVLIDLIGQRRSLDVSTTALARL